MKCGTGDEPRRTDTVFGYVLSGPVANVEGIKMNNQNQSSITTTHVSLTLERRHFDHSDRAMKKSCYFDDPFSVLHLGGSNETSHDDGPSYLGKDSEIDHFDSSNRELMSRFWDLETIGIKVKEPASVENFLRNIKMNENTNRYETSLPFKNDFVLLPDTYELCKKRLMSLYKTLKNDPELLETYDKTFKEQLSLGIIERIDTSNLKPGQIHYLPHLPVIRFDKETTNVRAVFDASAKVKSNQSLNDCLHKGPQLTPLIFDILLRFRCYAVALTPDIEKAFLQIGIVEPDKEFLRFLWFDDVFAAELKIVCNRFARAIFGVKSSHFLLNGTVRKHTSNYNFDNDFVTKIVDSFFVLIRF